MNDTKVLHEWTSKYGSELRLVQYPDWMDMQIKEPDGRWAPTSECATDDWEEIVRLASSVATLQRELADARRALDKYGQHHSHCNRTIIATTGMEVGTCTCGFNTARAAVSAPGVAREEE